MGRETPPDARMTLLTTKLEAEPDGLMALLLELADNLRERDVSKLVSRLRPV